MKILYIIPARGGSKGLPNKNIKPLLGKPLMAWSIETALKSPDGTVVVSTDSEQIADIAKQYGASVPFLRPDHLANDTAKSVDVVSHCLDFFEKQGILFDLIILLEPTSPQRSTEDIDSAIKQLIDTPAAQAIVGIAEVEGQHPDFLVKKEEGGKLTYLNPDFQVKRRQDISKLYFFEGSFYISRVDAFKKYHSFYHEHTLGFEMPKWKSFEIDDYTDFLIVEKLMEYYLTT